MLKPFLEKLVEGRSLSEEEAAAAMRALIAGEASESQAGAYLTALRVKGETVAEMLGSARVVRAATVRVHSTRRELLDTCGTGGDGAGTFNVSTAAALVAAGAGASVAKHGNRAVSSRCGSADLLEACGVPMDLGAEAAGKVLDEAGIVFLFAPALNTAMASVGPLRRRLGIRTLFNLIGPLANPAHAERQLLGVYDARWVGPLAEVLAGLGSRRALVVHGEGGLDEISIAGPTRAALLDDGRVTALVLAPEDLGLPRYPREAIAGGGPEENRARLTSILEGAPGPWRDAVVANAGAALWVAGFAEDAREGARLAASAIDSGAAASALARLVDVSRRHATAERSGP